MCFNVTNLLFPDDIFTVRPFLTEKIKIRVINNNFEKGKRGASICFRDIYCKFNSKEGFIRFRSMLGNLFFSRWLFELGCLLSYLLVYFHAYYFIFMPIILFSCDIISYWCLFIMHMSGMYFCFEMEFFYLL